MKKGFSIIEVLICSVIAVQIIIFVLSLIQWIQEEKRRNKTIEQIKIVSILTYKVNDSFQENHFPNDFNELQIPDERINLPGEKLLWLAENLDVGRKILAQIQTMSIDSDEDGFLEPSDAWGNPLEYNGLHWSYAK